MSSLEKGVRVIRKLINVILIPLLILVAFIQMKPSTTWNDPDTFWHIELGQTMIHQKIILREAIHTFAGEHLPYVPHEIGFQLILGELYDLWGWKGVHILTVFCLGFMIWGLYRMAQVSRKEMGIDDMHPYLSLMIPIIALAVFLMYFKIRPQMISSPIIIWFFVYLREFQLKPSYSKVLAMGLLSLALSNVHAGVWPVIAVFFGMAIIESLWQRKMTKYHVLSFFFITLGGVLNTGGWKTLIYFQTIGKTGLTNMISEWQPINFSSDKIFFIILVIFIWSASHSAQKNLFRFIFMVGILYLGIANYKQHLYMDLFILYFLAVAVEYVPWLQGFKRLPWLVHPSFLKGMYGLGLFVNLLLGWTAVYHLPTTSYPVQEMDYILSHSQGRPKVLAPYAMSGYVMFRGGDTLADGRMDPFITDETKRLHNWTAFERSVYAFESDEIVNVIKEDNPQYVIVPKPKDPDKPWDLGQISYHKIHATFGNPAFTGDFGEVYKIHS